MQVGGRQVREVLIQWKGLPQEDATWEPLVTITEQFLDFDLGDKVRLERGGNVSTPALKFVYARRSKKEQGQESKLAAIGSRQG